MVFFKRNAEKSEIRLRLFLFPPAGGDVSTFLHWEEQMPRDVETCLVRLPGRGARITGKPLIMWIYLQIYCSRK